MDVLVDIPTLLARYDNRIKASTLGILQPIDVETEEAMLCTLLVNVDIRLRAWKFRWVDTQAVCHEWEVSSPEDGQVPVFQCRDEDTGEIITPKVIVYSSLRLASAVCTYYAARLLIASVNTHPTQKITPREQYTFACNICRTMDYYLRNCPGLLVNRMAFVLRVAYDCFPEGIERKYLREIFALVGRRYSLKMWSSTIPEISVRKPSTSPESSTDSESSTTDVKAN
jgi:hypothetical protein